MSTDATTTPAARALPVVVWVTADLPPGCPLVYRPGAARIRAAYDPQQIDLDDARGILRMFVQSRETETAPPAPPTLDTRKDGAR